RRGLHARHARAVGSGPARADPAVRQESASRVPLMELRIDERRLVELALRVVSTPSFTGSEQALAELMHGELAELGLHVQWQQVGVRLKGDLMIACVAGEIEKAQQGDAQGAEYRGYAAGSRHLVSHGGAADFCILGEPTENKLVLAHFGALWVRLSTTGPFVHTAFSEGRRDENSIIRMRDVLDQVLEWLPSWELEMSHDGVRGIANVGAIQGGFGWRASRTPYRTDLFLDLRVPPRVPMAEARRKALAFARSLRVEAEVDVSAPGSEIE